MHYPLTPRTPNTATSTFATSPATLFNSAIRKSSTARTLVTYAASATLLTLVHVLTAYIFETSGGNDPKLAPFVKSKYVQYDAYNLQLNNQRLLESTLIISTEDYCTSSHPRSSLLYLAHSEVFSWIVWSSGGLVRSLW